MCSHNLCFTLLYFTLVCHMIRPVASGPTHPLQFQFCPVRFRFRPAQFRRHPLVQPNSVAIRQSGPVSVLSGPVLVLVQSSSINPVQFCTAQFGRPPVLVLSNPVLSPSFSPTRFDGHLVRSGSVFVQSPSSSGSIADSGNLATSIYQDKVAQVQPLLLCSQHIDKN